MVVVVLDVVVVAAWVDAVTGALATVGELTLVGVAVVVVEGDVLLLTATEAVGAEVVVLLTVTGVAARLTDAEGLTTTGVVGVGAIS